jgi:hypothetical protein
MILDSLPVATQAPIAAGTFTPDLGHNRIWLIQMPAGYGECS